MSNLTKVVNQLSIVDMNDETLLSYMSSMNMRTLNVGDIFLSDDSTYGTIVRINKIDMSDFEEYGTIYIRYGQLSTGACPKDGFPSGIEGKYFSSYYGGDDIKEFLRKYAYSRVEGTTLVQLLKDAQNVIDGKMSIEAFGHTDVDVNSSQLMVLGSSEHLESMRDELTEKKKKAELMRCAVNHMMVEAKEKAIAMKRELEAIVAKFTKKVNKIMKVIKTIEIYVGLAEDIFQLQDGNTASIDDALTMRNLTMFMDEEVGDPENGGLDFRGIEDFDNWLLEYSKYYKKHNYEILAPEPRCVVLLRPRRTNKKYSDNPYINAMENIENHRSYLLIRNGECLYRVWCDFGISKLFPNKNELQSLYDGWGKLEDQMNEESISSYQSEAIAQKIDFHKEQIDDKTLHYKRVFLLLQGMIDRTDVFKPMRPVQLVTSGDAIEKGIVNLIYDNGQDGNLIGDGLPTFRQYMNKINEGVGVGDRVYWNCELAKAYNMDDCVQASNAAERFDKRYQQRYGTNYNLPPIPYSGIHTIKEYVEKNDVVRYDVAETFSDLPVYAIESYRRGKSDEWLHDKSNYPLKYAVQTSFQHGYKTLYRYVYDEVKTKHPAIFYPKYWDDYRYAIEDVYGDYDESDLKKMGRNVSYKIYLDEDINYIAYDRLCSKDLIPFLYDRRYRRSYLSAMPMLYGLYEHLVKQETEELHFKKMLVDEMIRNGEKIEDAKNSIDGALSWYKLKNKYKRGIGLSEYGDDAKARRMIRKRLKLPV